VKSSEIINVLTYQFLLYTKKGELKMTQPKHRREGQFKRRKQAQNPHGKVKSFEEIADEVSPGNLTKAQQPAPQPKDYDEIEY
jgi:hypothetical protein